jgi:hypothetical protein
MSKDGGEKMWSINNNFLNGCENRKKENKTNQDYFLFELNLQHKEGME